MHELINCIWKKEDLPEKWKESIIVPIYKKADKIDRSNCRGMSLLSNTYKLLSNILLSWLTPQAEEIIGDRHCGFRRSSSATARTAYSAVVKYLRKKGTKFSSASRYL